MRTAIGFPGRLGLASLAVAILLSAGTALGAGTSDEDVFKYRAYPNLLIVLDRSSDMSVYDNVAVNDIDGNGVANRYDLALKVLFRILNADGSRTDNNSTPPNAASVESYGNSLITVDDELYLAQRIGLLYYDNAVHSPTGPPFQVYAPNRTPNLPPYSSTTESWRYTAIWDNVYALGPPATGSVFSFQWSSIQTYFNNCASGDNSVDCRPKVTVLIVTPDSFDSSHHLWGGTIDNTYNPFVLVVGNPNARELKNLYKTGSNIPEGRIAFFSINSDIENSVIFDDMVAQLQASTFEFVAPVVPAVRTTDNNRLFVASFTPATGGGVARALWQGHLISFDLNTDGTIPNPIVTNWDAATRLASQAPSTRNIYTSSSGTRYSFDTTYITTTMLGVSTTTVRDNVVDTVRSLRLGDIFHSTPVVVGPPSRYFADVGGLVARQEFVDTYANRKRVILAGANDGMLHAFNAGNWNASLTPPGYNDGTGDEEWAYIPGFLLGNVKNFVNFPSVHNYYVDSAAAVADIWVDGTPPPSIAAKLPTEWHTVVIGGAGKGGKGYYALDITNPNDTGYPAVLWELTTDPADADKKYIGQTWSTPAIGKIQTTTTISGEDYVVDKWVAIVGGGMGIPTGNGVLTTALNLSQSAGGLPRTVANLYVDSTGNAPVSGSITLKTSNKTATGTYTSKTATSFDNVYFPSAGNDKTNYPVESLVSWGGGTEGNAIFVLNAWTGAILQRLTGTDMGSVVAQPVILNNSYGYIERVYVGDLNGNIWRATFDNTANWSLGGAPFFAVTGSTYSKKIYTKAAVFGGTDSYAGSNWIAFGTGDRENPMDILSGSNGAVFVVKDADSFTRQGMTTTTIPQSDLQDESGFLSAVRSDPTSGTFLSIGTKGWWGSLGGVSVTTGEKMLSSPAIFNGNVFFTTFEPEIGDCEVGGTARIYGFGALSGSYGLYSDTALAANTAADKRMIAYTAAGIPSSPVVSVNSSGIATLYFGTTGSSIKSLKIPSPTTTKTLKYWREVH
jgi:Tfp pilus tip-associated adhesin PilY1